jgi:hypothetical protein
MGCNCASKTAKKTYVYTSPGGLKKTYSTETEAKAAVARGGGSYKSQ